MFLFHDFLCYIRVVLYSGLSTFPIAVKASRIVIVRFGNEDADFPILVRIVGEVVCYVRLPMAHTLQLSNQGSHASLKVLDFFC